MSRSGLWACGRRWSLATGRVLAGIPFVGLLLLGGLPGRAAAEGTRPADLLWDSARGVGALANGTTVQVVREVTDAAGVQHLAVQGEVVAPGASHLAAGLDDGYAYASASGDGQLKFIDLASAHLLHQVPAAGPQPGPLVYHPILHKLASFNQSGGITLFDTQSRAYEGLLPIGEQPSAVLLAPDGRVVALLPGQADLLVLSLRPFRPVARLPLPATCTQPAALAADPATLTIFLACAGGQVAVFDLREGEWRADWVPPPSAGDAPAPAWQLFWDARATRLFGLRPNGELVQFAPTAAAARLVLQAVPGSVAAWDPPGHRLLLAEPAGAVNPAARDAVPLPYQFSFRQVP